LGKRIDERPSVVDTREEFVHWEGDGIVGQGQHGLLITLVERKLGMYVV
jgi:IS30 family transposase